MLGMFSCDITVVANDVIMQRTQRCPGLSETRQVNRYIVIWLARSLRAHEASQHVIGLIWVVHWLYCSGCWFHHLDSAYLHIILQILRFAVKLCWLNMETWLWGDFFFFFFFKLVTMGTTTQGSDLSKCHQFPIAEICEQEHCTQSLT